VFQRVRQHPATTGWGDDFFLTSMRLLRMHTSHVQQNA